MRRLAVILAVLAIGGVASAATFTMTGVDEDGTDGSLVCDTALTPTSAVYSMEWDYSGNSIDVSVGGVTMNDGFNYRDTNADGTADSITRTADTMTVAEPTGALKVQYHENWSMVRFSVTLWWEDGIVLTDGNYDVAFAGNEDDGGIEFSRLIAVHVPAWSSFSNVAYGWVCGTDTSLGNGTEKRPGVVIDLNDALGLPDGTVIDAISLGGNGWGSQGWGGADWGQNDFDGDGTRDGFDTSAPAGTPSVFEGAPYTMPSAYPSPSGNHPKTFDLMGVGAPLVPEPMTMLVLGGGLLALIRKR